MGLSVCRPPIAFAGRDLDEPINLLILGGEVVLFTHGSPTPNHDNEDAVGVVKWGGKTGVLAVANYLEVGMLHSRFLRVLRTQQIPGLSIRWSLASSLPMNRWFRVIEVVERQFPW